LAGCLTSGTLGNTSTGGAKPGGGAFTRDTIICTPEAGGEAGGCGADDWLEAGAATLIPTTNRKFVAKGSYCSAKLRLANLPRFQQPTPRP